MTSIERDVLARKLPYEIRMQRRAKRDLQRLSDEDDERVNTYVRSLLSPKSSSRRSSQTQD